MTRLTSPQFGAITALPALYSPVLLLAGIILMLFGALTAHAGNAPQDLRAALEKVWARNPQARVLDARQAEVEAQRTAANSLFPNAPALDLSAASDRLLSDEGQRSVGADLEMPLWLPGQRTARNSQVNASQLNLRGDGQALRWHLAGELREAMWAVALAESEEKLAQQRAQAAQVLQEDVARRKTAGDLAQTDLNLAQNEALAAQGALLGAQSRFVQARLAYTALVGEPGLPAEPEETLQPISSLDHHPRLEAARSAIELAQAQLGVVRASRRDNPELGVGVQRSRETAGAADIDSLNITLRLPFATQARNQPLMASAQTALTQALSDYDQARRELELQIAQAEQSYQTTQETLALAERQHSVTAENLALTQKAFDLGELSLLNLLQVRANTLAAAQNAAQQRIALSLSKARLNQARGILP